MSSFPNGTHIDSTRSNSTSLDRASLRERVRQATRKIEAEIILEALKQHRWNRRRTAEALRISYRSLMYKMKNCNVRDDNPVLAAGDLQNFGD
jgi:transcriptional regulator with PAS, ATPase and Fis domain